MRALSHEMTEAGSLYHAMHALVCDFWCWNACTGGYLDNDDGCDWGVRRLVEHRRSVRLSFDADCTHYPVHWNNGVGCRNGALLVS
jgi:hypothetical protein